MTEATATGRPYSFPSADELRRWCFVLGAGFSHAAAGLPLLSGLGKWLYPGAHGDQGVPRLRPLYESLDSNMELFLSYLSEPHPWLSEPQNLRNRADFLESAQRVGGRIAGVQNEALLHHQRSHMKRPDWFWKLVQLWHEHRQSVVTFNYDTLVEKAASSSEGPGVDCFDLYTIPIQDVRTRNGTGMWGGERTDTFQYFKLHGSLNWYYSGAASFYGENIYGVRPTPGWKPDENHGARPFDKVPLIVPPTAQKSPYFANETLNAQWGAAYGTMSNASDIFFIGYSLPETDQMVRFMLASLSNYTTVWIVNQGSAQEREALRQRYRNAMKAVTVRDDYLVEKDSIERLVSDLPYRLPDGPRAWPDTMAKMQAASAEAIAAVKRGETTEQALGYLRP